MNQGVRSVKTPHAKLPTWQDEHKTSDYKSNMKKQPRQKRRTRRPGVNRVPFFEECLTFVMDNLSHSRDGLKASTLSAKQKQRFRQMEWKSNALDLDEYRNILRRILGPGLHDMTPESGAHVALLHGELREFFKRYEILSWQVAPGEATHQQVLWAMSHRFLLPWLALRIAFRLRDDSDVGATVDDCWFIPLRGGKLSSCVMKVIDRFVRKKGESNIDLAQRLYHHDNFSTEKQKAHGLILEGHLRKYSELKTTPSDGTIKVVVEASPSILHLRLMLVLARFIDRCLRAASKVFHKEPLLELLDYFVVCLVHFRSVLKLVRLEHPAAEPDKVWDYLHSWTYTGNTPGQQERFCPLMDRYMNELQRKINAELQQASHRGELCHMPRDMKELDAGQWCFPKLIPIPVEIENAPIRETVSNAVAASRRAFRGRINIAQAVRARWIFTFMGMETFTALARGYQGHCTVGDATIALDEAKRLFQLTHDKVPAGRKSDDVLAFLEFLIEPCRPKLHEERKLARALFSVVRKSFRKENRLGAVEYLDGCLHALEGNDQGARRAFSRAKNLGRESCGHYWMDLLRVGLMTAEKVGSTREKANFIKLLKLYGVFSNDAAPRTNELKAQMQEDSFRRNWSAGFKPFPTE